MAVGFYRMQELGAWYVVWRALCKSSDDIKRYLFVLNSWTRALLFVGYTAAQRKCLARQSFVCVNAIQRMWSENLQTRCIQMQPEWESRERCDSTKIIKSSTRVASTSWQNFRFASAMHFNIILFFAPLKKTRLTSCFAMRLERKSVVFTDCVQLQLSHRSCLLPLCCTFSPFECLVCLFMLGLRERAHSLFTIYLLSSLAMGNDEYNSNKNDDWFNESN